MTWRHLCAVLAVFAFSLATTGCSCARQCRVSASPCCPSPAPCCPTGGVPAAPVPAVSGFGAAPCAH